MLPEISELFEACQGSREQVVRQEETTIGVDALTNGLSEDDEDDYHEKIKSDDNIGWTNEEEEDVLVSDKRYQ